MRYFWLLLAVVVTAVIFVNSSLPATESGSADFMAFTIIKQRRFGSVIVITEAPSKFKAENLAVNKRTAVCPVPHN